MKILYIAKHDSGGGDDEGAISFALESLGHNVFRVPESVTEKDLEWFKGADLCLFHKWTNFDLLKKIDCPKAFWYFDLVDWPSDPTLARRCKQRKGWMSEVIPLVDIGFCTDGDWVEKVNQDALEDPNCTFRKIYLLRQGADERVVGFGREVERDIDVLMVGIGKGGGIQRESFVADLRGRYGDRFTHVTSSVYGRALANLVARAKIVVCPDSPVTDRYWSNRVYVLGGFGACLLHPDLNDLMIPNLLYLKGSREHLFKKIDENLSTSESDRQYRRERILACIKREYLYRHRCEELLRMVKERLGV